MYPKSPFNASAKHLVYQNIKDDYIIHFSIEQIPCNQTKQTFNKIKMNINKINEQLYNLRVSKQSIKQNDCQNLVHIKDIMDRLVLVKQSFVTKAHEIMNKFEHKEELGRIIKKKSFIQ
tara:strand:- start:1461 stop:1817 length:357 start_codon:yes stop_codon:yes gene_type:complete